MGSCFLGGKNESIIDASARKSAPEVSLLVLALLAHNSWQKGVIIIKAYSFRRKLQQPKQLEKET